MNRGLTTEQAERGVQPPVLTKAEWRAMHDTSLIAMEDALQRTADHTFEAMNRRTHEAR